MSVDLHMGVNGCLRRWRCGGLENCPVRGGVGSWSKTKTKRRPVVFFFFSFFSFITLLVDRSSQIINLFWLLSEAVKFFCFWFFLERPKRSKVRAKGFPEIHNLLKRSVQR